MPLLFPSSYCFADLVLWYSCQLLWICFLSIHLTIFITKSTKILFCIWRLVPRTHRPKQNGIAERMNQTIQEQIVYMLQYSRLLDGFLEEGLLTTIHIINKSPSRPLGLQIPQELWSGSKPNYDKMRIFGCEAYALILKDDRRKHKPRFRKLFSLAMDQMARSDTHFGTLSTNRLSEVWT